MRYILIFILLFSLNNSFSQSASVMYHTDSGNKIFLASEVDVKAEYKGGIYSLGNEVAKKFRAPEFNNMEKHKIYISFVVETDGSISDIISITEGEEKLKKEGIRVFKLLPNNWIPAIKEGVSVRMQYNFPINVIGN